jgi:hypothetical protein
MYQNPVSPVDLKIIQDWSKVVTMVNTIIEKSKTHHSEIRPYGNATFYDLGNHGSVIHHHISENWFMVHSKLLEKHLTWLPKMLADMSDLNPTWLISVLNSNAAEHTDFNHYPTALNYPINTTNAETYVKYLNQEFTYPSITDQPWLLSTKNPHGVRNNELRLVFNMHFGADYDVVRQWLDFRPNLVYGN